MLPTAETSGALRVGRTRNLSRVRRFPRADYVGRTVITHHASIRYQHHPCDANASTTTKRLGSVPPGPVTLDAPFSTTTTTIPAKLGQCEYTTLPYMHAREHEELCTRSIVTPSRTSNRKRIQNCPTNPSSTLRGSSSSADLRVEANDNFASPQSVTSRASSDFDKNFANRTEPE